jgi:hypothetical protein
MPIDARIPLLGQAPHIEQFDLAKPLLAAAQLQEIKAQGQYRQLLADKYRQDNQRRVAFGEVLSRYDLDNPQESRQALRELSRIDPQASLEVRSNVLAGQKEQRLAQSAELDYLEKQNRMIGQVAQSILDAEDRGDDPQPLYEEGVAYLGSKDIPVQGLSPTYSRQLVTMFRDRSLTAADRISQMNAQRQQAEFEEQKRANQAREKQQERQDETTRRGQDLRATASADKRTAAEKTSRGWATLAVRLPIDTVLMPIILFLRSSRMSTVG